MKSKRQIAILIITGIILLIPLIAMQFSDEVDWKFFDFVVAGTLLIGSGFIFDFGLRKITNKTSLILFSIALLLVLVLLWIELAVGLFGSPIAGD